MISVNPLLEERLRRHFDDKPALRLYRIYILVLSLVVLAAWPSSPVSFYLQFSSVPNTLQMTFILMFIFAFILATTAEYSHGRSETSLSDWITYTPISVIRAYVGRFQFFAAHSMFLLLLPSPLLIAATAASGRKIPETFAALGVILVFCVFTKTLILMLELIFYKRVFARYLGLGIFLVFTILLSVQHFPAANPILAMQSLIGKSDKVGSIDNLTLIRWTDTIIIYVAAIVAASSGILYKLTRIRKEAERLKSVSL